MNLVFKILPLVLLLSACSYTGQLQQFARDNTVTAVEQRKQLNDDQARFTTAALCDISIGAYWRTLSTDEQALVDVVCSK